MKNKALALRILAIVLVSAMALVALVACVGDKPVETPPVNETPSETPEESPPEEIIKEPIELIKNGKCGYTIIRPELASEDIMVHIRSFRSKMNDLTGDLVKLAEDWLNPIKNEQPGEFEILLGNTNREETQKVLSELKYNDWAIEIVNKKLVITGHTDEKTAEAIDYFVKNFLDVAGDEKIETLTFAPENCYTYADEYMLDNMTVGGVSVKEYTVVYPAFAQKSVVNCANSIAEYISTMTGFKINAVKDSVEETEYEILVGKCNRDETNELVAGMKSLDYTVSVKGTKLVILGGSNQGCETGGEEFIKYVDGISEGKKEIALASGDIKNYKHPDYLVGELIIGDRNISDYRIVYESDNTLAKLAAEMLSAMIDNITGVFLPIVNDTKPVGESCEILLGFTNRTDKGGVAADLLEGYDKNEGLGYAASNGKYVVVCGKYNFSMTLGKFISALTPAEKTERYEVDLSKVNSQASSFEQLNVMSFNILTHPTKERFDQIAEIIKQYSPDVIGFQEVTPASMSMLKATFGDRYGYINLERDRASRESTPLFYDKTKYNLIESGSGWLSDTPDVMSKYPESDYHRVYVYAVLENKETGTKFVHVNTHIDYVGEVISKQINVLLERTKHLANLPMFYTADWNMSPSAEGYRLMTEAGYLDAATMTDNTDLAPTMVGGGARIDFCFTSMRHTFVGVYDVIDGHEVSDTASDHYAVYTELYIAPIK